MPTHNADLHFGLGGVFLMLSFFCLKTRRETIAAFEGSRLLDTIDIATLQQTCQLLHPPPGLNEIYYISSVIRSGTPGICSYSICLLKPEHQERTAWCPEGQVLVVTHCCKVLLVLLVLARCKTFSPVLTFTCARQHRPQLKNLSRSIQIWRHQ